MSKIDLEEERKKEQLRKDLEDLKRQERAEEIKESLEVIGNSLLSGLATVTSVSVRAIEEAVEQAKYKNSKDYRRESDKIKKKLELRKRQDVLKKVKKAEKKQKKKVTDAKFIAGLGAFFVTWLVFNIGLLPSIGAGVIANYLVGRFYHPKKELAGIALEEIGYTQEYVDIIKKANEQMNCIYECVDKAEDAEIRDQSLKLYERGIEILDYLEEHPSKITKSGRFLSYYLETAAKICDKYLDFSKTSQKSEDVNDVIESTKKAMILLEKAFDNEFLKLVEDDIIDIEADVKVLENSMKWDNYMD